MSDISQNIKLYRKSANLTQAALAKLLEKKPSVIANWEAGTNKPDVNLVIKMCSIFKIDANTLIGWEDDEIKKEPAIDKTASSIQSILFDKLGRPPTPTEIEKFQAFSEGYIKGLGESND